MFISEEYLRSVEITDNILEEFEYELLYQLSDEVAYNITLDFQQDYFPSDKEEGYEMFKGFLERFLETEEVSKEDEKIIREIIKKVEEKIK